MRFLTQLPPRLHPTEYNSLSIKYGRFIESVRNKLPIEVYEFATADWRSDYTSSKCLHDSWLESIEIKEFSIDGTNSNIRSNNIIIRLLGPKHDGRIVIEYDNVTDYKFERNTSSEDTWLSDHFKLGHGDWMVDEISISDNDSLIHYIEFSNNVNWEIHFENLIYKWIPFT